MTTESRLKAAASPLSRSLRRAVVIAIAVAAAAAIAVVAAGAALSVRADTSPVGTPGFENEPRIPRGASFRLLGRGASVVGAPTREVRS